MSNQTNSNLDNIQAIIMDVDGVLTDGTIYLGNGNTELRAFHARDGMAINIARRCGIKIGFLSSRKSAVVQRRGEELQIDYIFQGVNNKLSKLLEISVSENIPLTNICFIGDDIIDMPALKQVGFSATVCDAPDEVKSCTSFTSSYPGGKEAVRDIIRCILTHQNKWKRTIDSMIRDWETEA